MIEPLNSTLLAHQTKDEMMRTLFLLVMATIPLVCSQGPALAQSLHVESPALLAKGANQASVDSFVGPQFWTFTAQPGHFHLVFAGGDPQEGFAIGGRATAAIAFAPASRTSHYTVKESSSGASFDGSVAHTQKVVVEVEPRKSPLVRQTTDYVLTLSGNVDASVASVSGQGADPIIGVYISRINDAGAVRFSGGGLITAASGAKGRWALFDVNSKIYSVELSGLHLTAVLSPGRGLIDAGNHNLIFELQR